MAYMWCATLYSVGSTVLYTFYSVLYTLTLYILYSILHTLDVMLYAFSKQPPIQCRALAHKPVEARILLVALLSTEATHPKIGEMVRWSSTLSWLGR